MPEESSSSWSDLLRDLVRSFVLLRDLFGYVLPGALFLLIGAQSHHLSSFGDLTEIPGAESHPWLLVLLLLLISYFVGHFLIVAFYFPFDVITLLKIPLGKWRLSRLNDEQKKKRQKENEDAQKKIEKDASDFLRYNKQFPDIFIEYDRQSILALLRKGLAASVVLGLLVFHYLYMHPLRVMAAAGALMLFNTLSGHFHVKGLKELTRKAAEAAASQPKLPQK